MNFTKDSSNIIAASAAAIAVVSVIYSNVQLKKMRAEMDEMKEIVKLMISNNEAYKLELRALKGEYMANVEHKSMGVPPALASALAAAPVAPVAPAAPVAPVPAPAPSPKVSVVPSVAPSVSAAAVSDELFTSAELDEQDAFIADENIVRALRSQMISNSDLI